MLHFFVTLKLCFTVQHILLPQTESCQRSSSRSRVSAFQLVKNHENCPHARAAAVSLNQWLSWDQDSTWVTHIFRKWPQPRVAQSSSWRTTTSQKANATLGPTCGSLQNQSTRALHRSAKTFSQIMVRHFPSSFPPASRQHFCFTEMQRSNPDFLGLSKFHVRPQDSTLNQLIEFHQENHYCPLWFWSVVIRYHPLSTPPRCCRVNVTACFYAGRFTATCCCIMP